MKLLKELNMMKKVTLKKSFHSRRPDSIIILFFNKEMTSMIPSNMLLTPKKMILNKSRPLEKGKVHLAKELEHMDSFSIEKIPQIEEMEEMMMEKHNQYFQHVHKEMA